jgi:hypothetical protein
VRCRDQGLHLVSTTLVGQICLDLETIGLLLAPHYKGPALPIPRVGRMGEACMTPHGSQPETGLDAPRSVRYTLLAAPNLDHDRPSHVGHLIVLDGAQHAQDRQTLSGLLLALFVTETGCSNADAFTNREGRALIWNMFSWSSNSPVLVPKLISFSPSVAERHLCKASPLLSFSITF